MHVEWVEDPSNFKPQYHRNQIRLTLQDLVDNHGFRKDLLTRLHSHMRFYVHNMRNMGMAHAKTVAVA